MVHKLGRKGPRTTKELLDIATSHALGEEAVGAIFDRLDGKARWDEGASEGASNRSTKRKNKKQQCKDSLVVAADCKGGQKPTESTPNHFEKVLEGPCPNHAIPVKHLYKDYSLMWWFLSGGSNKGEHGKDPVPTMDDAEEKDDGFPMLDICLMIFGGSAAYDSKRSQKVARHEHYKTEPATLAFLQWSESAMTFD